MCTARPETIDGLWKLDNEWPKSKRLLAIPEQRELIVTISTALYRREVLRYINEILPAYAPTKRKVILYPCAWEISWNGAAVTRVPECTHRAHDALEKRTNTSFSVRSIIANQKRECLEQQECRMGGTRGGRFI
jgi:hypothetical protein